MQIGTKLREDGNFARDDKTIGKLGLTVHPAIKPTVHDNKSANCPNQR